MPDTPDAPHKNHESYFVPGLQRGLMLLEVLATERRPLSLTELAKRLGLTRSSVFRLAYTLRTTGFIETTDGSKTVALGPRVLNIGFAYLAGQDIIELARLEQEALRDATQVSSHLAIRDGSEVLYLSCVQTRSGFLSNMNVGTRLPAYASPMGWLLLADLSARDIAALFAPYDHEAAHRADPDRRPCPHPLRQPGGRRRPRAQPRHHGTGRELDLRPHLRQDRSRGRRHRHLRSRLRLRPGHDGHHLRHPGPQHRPTHLQPARPHPCPRATHQNRPASTLMRSPVTEDEASLARNNAAAATSAGSTQRRSAATSV